MIVAAGLTPAWQQIMLIDRLRLGEVNRAREVHWCASGKVLNVATALHGLGAACMAVSVWGGSPGEAIERELSDRGLHRRAIMLDRPTRICTTVIDRAGGQTTELVENAAPVTPEELRRFCEAYRAEAAHASVVVLTGSLPPGTSSAIYADLLRQTPARAIVDALGEELLAALEARPLLVKPNRDELAATVKRELADDAALVEAMRELNRRGAEWALVTQGKRAAWLAGPGVLYRANPLPVDVVNPIGCGDCLAAGLAAALADGAELPDAFRLGLAAAAQNARSLLPARLDAAAVRAAADRVELQRLG